MEAILLTPYFNLIILWHLVKLAFFQMLLENLNTVHQHLSTFSDYHRLPQSCERSLPYDAAKRFLALAIDHSLDLHYTDIYIIAPMDKFVIQHIFHQMRTFLLPEIQFGISQSKIDGIVLLDSIEILPTFHIIPFSTIEEKGIIHPSTATFVAIATVFAVGLSSEY